MSLLGIVIVLVIVGVLLYLVNTYIPMSAGIKKILNIVVIGSVILWLLSIFGIFGYIDHVSIRPLR